MLEHEVTAPGKPSTGEAASSAAAAASAADVQMRELDTVGDFLATENLFVDIWGRAGSPPVSSELLKALSKAGHYVGGAFSDGVLVGATVGFHSSPERRVLHSHIAGVSPAFAGHSVGFAMKLHQRAWAIERGIPAIEWTFDPLVSRNAHFNLNKLGATPVEYLDNFYGVMEDALNGYGETDRLLVRWELLDQAVILACAGQRIPTGRTPTSRTQVSGALVDSSPGEYSFVPVPEDIEALRQSNPERAREWRLAVREGLMGNVNGHGIIVGFDRGHGYILSNVGKQKQ